MTVAHAAAYVGPDAEKILRDLDGETARSVAKQLEELPSLDKEGAVQLPFLVEGVRGYRAALLPVGYVAIYRHLTHEEQVRFWGQSAPGEEGFLVAGLYRADEIPSPSLMDLLGIEPRD